MPIWPFWNYSDMQLIVILKLVHYTHSFAKWLVGVEKSSAHLTLSRVNGQKSPRYLFYISLQNMNSQFNCLWYSNSAALAFIN